MQPNFEGGSIITFEGADPRENLASRSTFAFRTHYNIRTPLVSMREHA
jgi:hypothetical protein